jgi:hypothetical protein
MPGPRLLGIRGELSVGWGTYPGKGSGGAWRLLSLYLLLVFTGTFVCGWLTINVQEYIACVTGKDITCQRGSARQCCKGHVSFLWEKPIFDPSHKPNPLSSNDKKLHDWFRWWPKPMCKLPLQSVRYGCPHAYAKYNDFVTFSFDIFLYFFSRNRVTAERSVAQTCMTAQTTRVDARTCIFGVSLMYACIKGSRIPKRNPKFRPLWEFEA